MNSVTPLVLRQGLVLRRPQLQHDEMMLKAAEDAERSYSAEVSEVMGCYCGRWHWPLHGVAGCEVLALRPVATIDDMLHRCGTMPLCC